MLSHTPYTATLCTLIVLQLDPDSPCERKPSLFALIQQELEDQPVSTAKQLVDRINDDEFMQWFEKGITSLDAFMDLLTTFRTAHIDPDSLIGQYLRKFTNANFEATADLWQELKRDLDGTRPKVYPITHKQLQDQIVKFQTTHASRSETPKSSAPAQHFLAFLQHSQQNEKEAAIKELHSYLHAVPLQYSTILLAAYHYEQGEHTLSNLATQEAIKVAQQSQDSACVGLCLGWLYQHNKSTEYTDIESNQMGLVEGMHLLRDVQMANQGQLPRPQHMTEEELEDYDGFNLQGLQSREQVGEILYKQKLVRAGFREDSNMSKLDTWIALNTYEMLPEDIDVAIQNLSRTCVYGTLMVDVSSPSLANKTLLEKLDSRGEFSKCVYSSCLEQIQTLRRQYGLPMEGIFSHDTALVLVEWAIRRGELSEARNLLDGLKSSLHPRLSNYEALSHDIKVQEAMLLWRMENFAGARDAFMGMITTCKDKGHKVRYAQILLYLVMMMLDSSKVEFFHALPSLMECISLCEDLELRTLHAAASSMLAEIHWRRGKAERGIAVLKAAIPELRKNAHVWLQGEAYVVLAKCHLRAKAPNVRQSLTALGQAEELFMLCHDCVRLRDIYNLKSQLYNHLHELDSRDKAALLFVEMSQHLASPGRNSALEQLFSSESSIERLMERPLPISIK